MSGANVSPIGRNKEKWFVQLPIIGGWNEPLFLVSPYRAHIRSAHARLRPLRRLRRFFLMGAATPPLPRRGVPFGCFATFIEKSAHPEFLEVRRSEVVVACRATTYLTATFSSAIAGGRRCVHG